MTKALMLQSAAFLLFVVTTFSLLQAGKNFRRVGQNIEWRKASRYAMNRLLPNAADRDTDWDYVDRSAWTDLAGLKMWGGVAALAAIAAVASMIIAGS